jgi:hypothetical protein
MRPQGLSLRQKGQINAPFWMSLWHRGQGVKIPFMRWAIKMEKGPKAVPTKNPFTVAPRLEAIEAEIIPHQSHKHVMKS